MDNLLAHLPIRLKTSGLKKLGIVLDADPDIGPETRWGQIKTVLQHSHYSGVPLLPGPHGTIIRGHDNPDVGVWIMPDNQTRGMLEDFVSLLVPKGDSTWNNVSQCVEEMPLERRLYRPQHISKAKIHTWLAWQETPGTPMGLAITKRFLDADAPNATMFLWIGMLFGAVIPEQGH